MAQAEPKQDPNIMEGKALGEITGGPAVKHL
jgi:hypothetical protein